MKEADAVIHYLPDAPPKGSVGAHALDGAQNDLARLHAAISQCSIFTADQHRLLDRHGKTLEWLIDLRPLLLDAPMLDIIAQAFWDRFAEKAPCQVGGLEMAAIPLLVAILHVAQQRQIPARGFIIRRERKTYGRGQVIEGDVTAGEPVILVDDIMNSGRSLEKARAVLMDMGIAPQAAFTVIDFESDKGRQWQRDHGVPLSSLFKLGDFGLKLKKARPPMAQQRYAPLWSFIPEGGNPYHKVPKSAPLLVQDMLFAGADTGHMRCLDAATGEIRWAFQAKAVARSKGLWSSPAYHDGKLFFGAYNGDVYCLEAHSGKVLWAQHACEWVGSSPLIIPEHGLCVIGLEYERPGAKGSMAALSIETGEVVWEAPLAAYQHGSAAYWAAGGLVVAGTNDHDVRAWQVATGEEVWRFPTKRSVKYAPAIDHKRGLVLAASFDTNIYVLGVEKGDLRAGFPTGNICYTTPLVTDDIAYCGSGDRQLYAINLDQLRVVAQRDLGARVYATPKQLGDRIIVGTLGGVLRELHPTTLETLGRLQFSDAIANAIAATPSGSVIYVPTSMGAVHAYARL